MLAFNVNKYLHSAHHPMVMAVTFFHIVNETGNGILNSFEECFVQRINWKEHLQRLDELHDNKTKCGANILLCKFVHSNRQDKLWHHTTNNWNCVS